MTEATLVRARIKPGKTERLRTWFTELSDREDEVLETLHHEGMYTETAFIETTDDSDYFYMFMEAADMEVADEAGDEEAYEIDEQHHEVLAETLTDDDRKFESIGHFTNPDRT
ncbi:DUF6176 family protein [Halorussus amylolyticus]|uniref:DUF6176 family protein n=1 Tax=Halorussus amylolyticus TaxID=1126242 RepID=UPI00104CB276|nr:DUF6176 family protein [Halorussus amylolyticus]